MSDQPDDDENTRLDIEIAERDLFERIERDLRDLAARPDLAARDLRPDLAELERLAANIAAESGRRRPFKLIRGGKP